MISERTSPSSNSLTVHQILHSNIHLYDYSIVYRLIEKSTKLNMQKCPQLTRHVGLHFTIYQTMYLAPERKEDVIFFVG